MLRDTGFIVPRPTDDNDDQWCKVLIGVPACFRNRQKTSQSIVSVAFISHPSCATIAASVIQRLSDVNPRTLHESWYGTV